MTPVDLAPAYRLEIMGAVALATLTRAEARNALSFQTLASLRALLEALEARTEIRALVIAHEGPAFSAGHDLKEIAERRADPDEGRRFFGELLASCAALMTGLRRSRLPAIAAVEGIATAAGCQLVASCDLAVAGAQARFATPGVHIGLFCSTPMVALSRDVAPKHAMEMLLLGDPIDAQEAWRIGLVNRVSAAGRAREEALALAHAVAAKSGATTALGKRAFYEQLELSLDEAYARAARVMTENLLARDAREGVAAFLGKREPTWEQP